MCTSSKGRVMVFCSLTVYLARSASPRNPWKMPSAPMKTPVIFALISNPVMAISKLAESVVELLRFCGTPGKGTVVKTPRSNE